MTKDKQGFLLVKPINFCQHRCLSNIQFHDGQKVSLLIPIIKDILSDQTYLSVRILYKLNNI